MNDAFMKKFEEEYHNDSGYKNDPNGFSALHYVARNNSKELGEILISKGADINAKDIIYQIIKLLFSINGI